MAPCGVGVGLCCEIGDAAEPAGSLRPVFNNTLIGTQHSATRIGVTQIHSHLSPPTATEADRTDDGGVTTHRNVSA